jgi:2-keto-3-deoxy-L-rhamnonate aldolase RhmA
MSTEQTKSILATFDAQDMVSPSFGAEALDELHKKSIDRSPETMKAVEHIMEHGFVLRVWKRRRKSINACTGLFDFGPRYVILPSLLTPDQCARVKAAAHYYQGVRDQSGRTRFEGGKTTRVNNLLNKSDAADPLVLNEKMLNVLDHILSPNYLVSATQVRCVFGV